MIYVMYCLRIKAIFCTHSIDMWNQNITHIIPNNNEWTKNSSSHQTEIFTLPANIRLPLFILSWHEWTKLLTYQWVTFLFPSYNHIRNNTWERLFINTWPLFFSTSIEKLYFGEYRNEIWYCVLGLSWS